MSRPEVLGVKTAKNLLAATSSSPPQFQGVRRGKVSNTPPKGRRTVISFLTLGREQCEDDVNAKSSTGECKPVAPCVEESQQAMMRRNRHLALKGLLYPAPGSLPVPSSVAR